MVWLQGSTRMSSFSNKFVFPRLNSYINQYSWSTLRFRTDLALPDPDPHWQYLTIWVQTLLHWFFFRSSHTLILFPNFESVYTNVIGYPSLYHNFFVLYIINKTIKIIIWKGKEKLKIFTSSVMAMPGSGSGSTLSQTAGSGSATSQTAGSGSALRRLRNRNTGFNTQMVTLRRYF